MANVPGGSLGPPVYGGGGPPGGFNYLPSGSSSVFGGPTSYTDAVPPSGSPIPTPSGPYYSGANKGPFVGGGPFTYQQPLDPGLTTQLASFLSGHVGTGATPFNLSTALPFGGTTAPGELNAPANPLLQNLMNLYSGKASSIPGASTLSTIANQGISALPEWQAMVQAMGSNIAQGQAGIAEQLGSTGNLAGTPYGNALANFNAQVTTGQNALLGQLQQQNILEGQIPVAEGLLSGGQQFGQYAQALNQQAIQNKWNEFIRTQPEYSPLLQYIYGLSTSFAPALNRAGNTGGGVLAGLNLSPSFSFPSSGQAPTFM